MTQKEKAEELVGKYYQFMVPNYTGIYEAKQCALIAVEFASSQLDVKIRPPRLDIQVELNKRHLTKLKEEIEKL